MAATIRLTELDLGTGITHVSTDYQISTDPLYAIENIVAESIDNSVNLTSIIFNTVLDPTIKYYGRTRVRLNTGYTSWSNIDVFIPTDINDIELDIDIPSIVAIPAVTLSHSKDAFPVTGFDITTSGFGVIGTAKHMSTTYFIEDLNGETVWSSEDNNYNKTTIHVNDIVLKTNTVYRIKVMFNSSSSDTSQIVTTTIRTMQSTYVKLVKPLSGFNYNVDNYVNIFNYPNITSVAVVVYALLHNETIEVFQTTQTVTPTSVLIPNNTLKDKSNYLISLKTNLDTEFFYGLFSTY